MCQRPKRAFIISTHKHLGLLLRTKQGVNALNGLLSFLHRKYETCTGQFNGCQRPKRAFIISTVPAENPHKHWLCGLIFAGICLKILKSSIFCSFSGMFTVYSYFQLIFQPLPYKHYTLASSKMKVTFLIFVSTSYLQPLSSILN